MVYTLSGVRFPTVPSVYKSHGFSSNGDRRNANFSVFLKKNSVSRIGRSWLKSLLTCPNPDLLKLQHREKSLCLAARVIAPNPQQTNWKPLRQLQRIPQYVSTDVDSKTMEQTSQIKTENGDVEPASSLTENVEELDFASSLQL
ncbi:Starch branching enzyme IIa [Datura stramonium]|uniref:Starch branching enzyme IIa n=1 Tax=Datura stramonium TaxID=4076 RepID=A0ABS8RHB3_DATST|nr:Starch branching enzyme IIa [Datura stramonium]